jgi:dipeptidyl aminopeptidase/acylaminoacyl peptidase
MATGKTTEPQLIPRAVLFGNPVKTAPRLSPDGKRMAYIAPVDNVLNVWVGPADGSNFQPVTKDTDRGIRSYFWAEDGVHLLYVQDVGGNENWRLYAVNLDSGEIRDLTPFEGVQTQVIAHEKHYPNELLIGLNKDNPQVHDIYRVDLPTGELTVLAKNPGTFMGWLPDTDLQVRAALAATPDGGSELMVRADETSDWRTLVAWNPDDTLSSEPLSFSKDGQNILLRDSRDANAARLVRLDIGTGDTQLLAEDPQYDVGQVVLHPDTYEVQMVGFARARLEWTVLDPAIENDIAAIRGLHAGDFQIVSRDHADQTWLVAFIVDNGPIAYYTYDRATRKGAFLFENQPDLAKYTLAPMAPIEFQSRDGRTVHGYLTLPPGQEGKNLPVVLNVHGGPWGRDAWGYDPEAQWLANRGYACLQVNFRGSTGYGKDFLNAGDREWGGKMHDDLVDAVQWAVDQGIADPARVAIYGGSYGGYAALVGATFTPDLFCCAVDIVGPSNLVTLLKSIPPYWSTMRATMYKRVGNPETEPAFLESRSPLFKADRIQIPMLIAQGANDPRVAQAEAEQIVEAMKQNGVNYEYMLFPDEGHGFAKPENRIKFYTAAEKFLAAHLGGRYEDGAA